jgi:CheY-like chemotaxis protein/HPt (histidine-containing phosphotransfer) domain-containing protein
MPHQVLVIDDDAPSREVLTLLLEAAGYAAESADSGEAAISLMQSSHSLPHAILTDLQMPGITGNELAQHLRLLCGPATTILAMSATAPEDHSERNFDGFLLKPFTIGAFTAALAGTAPKPATDSQTKEIAVLDESTYSKLVASMRPQQLEQLYALCLADIDSRLTQMRSAAASGNAAIYRAEAHAIKGSCGMVGAIELQTLATSMEMRGLSDDHVASLKEFPLAARRLRRILIARETSHHQASESQEKMRDEGSNKKV